MKTAVLIGLSRHRIGVDGAGVTTLVAFHGCPLNCKSLIHKHCRQKEYGSDILLMNCLES